MFLVIVKRILHFIEFVLVAPARIIRRGNFSWLTYCWFVPDVWADSSGFATHIGFAILGGSFSTAFGARYNFAFVLPIGVDYFEISI